MTGTVYGADEAISMEEAIRAYTALGAYLNFEEDKKARWRSASLPTWYCCRKICCLLIRNALWRWTSKKNLDRGSLVYDRDSP